MYQAQVKTLFSMAEARTGQQTGGTLFVILASALAVNI